MRKSSHPYYGIWSLMVQRCENPNYPNFKYYGERGIKVCPRWRKDFWAFVADMGERPSPEHTMDRKDNNGDYTPKNCRWATKREQMGNTSANAWIEFRGRKMILSDWAREFGITAGLLSSRLKIGWTMEKAVTTPVVRQHRKTFIEKYLQAA